MDAGSISDADTAGVDVRTFASDKFNAVQDLLDTNKLLITEINNNHEERSPESLARNVLLIREFNSNIHKIIQLYKELSESIEQIPDTRPGQHKSTEATT